METKHTPGPFAPNCDNAGCKCGGRAMKLKGLRFVCTRDCTLEAHIDDFPLYAGVPDLLDACEMSAQRWEDLAAVITKHGRYDNAGFCRATVQRIRAAITKAIQG